MFSTFKTLAFAIVVALVVSPSFGDEYILDSKNESEFVGDFSVSSCNHHPTRAYQLAPGTQSITAGELWKHFKSRGIVSTNHLIISMDLEPTELNLGDEDVGVDQVELCIKDPYDGAILTSFSLDRDGDNSLIVPGYGTSSYRAEATMEIDLGFDFMERFSEASSEQVFLNIEMNSKDTSAPSLFISSKPSLFTMPDFSMLAIFAAFWTIVFFVLFRFTRPDTQQQNNQAVSA